MGGRIRIWDLLGLWQGNVLFEQRRRLVRTRCRPADEDQVVESKILVEPFGRQNPDHACRVIGLDLSENLD